jgi:hypothetical protein
MPSRRIFVSVLDFLVLAFAMLGCPAMSIAQHHGGGHGGMGGGIPGGSNRPTGVDEKDSLKDFHHALAVQATSQQIAEFQALIKSTEKAQAVLQSFRKQLSKTDNAVESTGHDTLDGAIQAARDGARKFQDGFSAEQKSGLKEIVKRLDKSDSDLELEEKRLDHGTNSGPETEAHAESMDKALSDFYNQELVLGREMNIVLANGQDLAFTLPQTKSPVRIEGRTIAITVSGVLSQIAVQADQRTFRLELLADLSDLQENITELLRSQLDAPETCGQRVEVRQASLAPSTPASLLVVKLHFERWICRRSFGQQSATELAEGDGSVEIKLTPTLEKNVLKIAAAFGRIDATGMLEEAIRSGSLGDDLREKAVRSVLAAAQADADFNIALPPAVRNSAVIVSAKFQDAGVGGLGLVLDGQIEISNEQANQLANQLNQSLSTHGGTPQPPVR